MTRRLLNLLTVRPFVWRLLLGCILAAHCAGCASDRRWPSLSPRTHGTWTGRVAPITVFDRTGRAYDAAVLEIETGPKPRVSPTLREDGVEAINVPPEHRQYPAALGAGRKPLLTKAGDVQPMIWPVSDLPIGKRVEVRGYMTGSSLPGPEGYRVTRLRPDPGDDAAKAGQIEGEHILVVRGRPRVLRE